MPLCKESLGYKKLVRVLVPASSFSGKLKLFVQAAHGSLREDLVLLGGAGWNFGLKIAEVGLGPSSGLYTDARGDYWLINIDGVSGVSIVPLGIKCTNLLKQKRKTISNWGGGFDNERNKIEAYSLAYATPKNLNKKDEFTGWLPLSNGNKFSEDDYGAPITGGWKFNWKGNEAHIVRVRRVQTCGDPFGACWAKQSWLLKFVLHDSGEKITSDYITSEGLDWARFVKNRFSWTFSVVEESELWDFAPSWDGVFVPEMNSGREFMTLHRDCHADPSVAGSGPVYCYYKSDDTLRVFYYTGDPEYPNSSVNTLDTCWDNGNTMCGCGKEYCREVTTQTGRRLGKFTVDGVDVGGISASSISSHTYSRSMEAGVYETGGCSGWESGLSYLYFSDCCDLGNISTQFYTFRDLCYYTYNGDPLIFWDKEARADRKDITSTFSGTVDSTSWLVIPWYNAESAFIVNATQVIPTSISTSKVTYTSQVCERRLTCYFGWAFSYNPQCGTFGVPDPYGYGQEASLGNRIGGCYDEDPGKGKGVSPWCTYCPPNCNLCEANCPGYRFNSYDCWDDSTGRIEQPTSTVQTCGGSARDEKATEAAGRSTWPTKWMSESSYSVTFSSGNGRRYTRVVNFYGKAVDKEIENVTETLGTVEWKAVCGDDSADFTLVSADELAGLNPLGDWAAYTTGSICLGPTPEGPRVVVLESVSGNLNGFGSPRQEPKLYDGFSEYKENCVFVGWE